MRARIPCKLKCKRRWADHACQSNTMMCSLRSDRGERESKKSKEIIRWPEVVVGKIQSNYLQGPNSTGSEAVGQPDILGICVGLQKEEMNYTGDRVCTSWGPKLRRRCQHLAFWGADCRCVGFLTLMRRRRKISGGQFPEQFSVIEAFY
jgi:hypothetical protein